MFYLNVCIIDQKKGDLYSEIVIAVQALKRAELQYAVYLNIGMKCQSNLTIAGSF